MPKRNPFASTAEDYERDEIIYPGRMSDYLAYLNDEEKAFYKDVITMYDDLSKKKTAGEVALGIIEARRVDERRSPEQEIDTTRRFIEGDSYFSPRGGFGYLGNRTADVIYGKKTPGDRMPQNMIEGQRLAEAFGPDFLSDDDFMRVSIAQMVEQKARPEKGMIEDIVDAGSKFIRDQDFGGFDDARSPTGIRFEPTPPVFRETEMIKGTHQNFKKKKKK